MRMLPEMVIGERRPSLSVDGIIQQDSWGKENREKEKTRGAQTLAFPFILSQDWTGMRQSPHNPTTTVMRSSDHLAVSTIMK